MGVDTNNNGLPDTWETANFSGITTNNGPDDDYDGDGLTNRAEYLTGTNPKDVDSDYDGRSDKEELAEGTAPMNANSFRPTRLALFSMSDSALLGDSGQAPRNSVNNELLAGYAGKGLNAATTEGSLLMYKDVESSGKANINLRRGTVRFWVRPYVSSGGDLQSWGRLLEVGSWSPDASYGVWTIYYDPTASQVLLATQNNSRWEQHFWIWPAGMERGGSGTRWRSPTVQRRRKSISTEF